MLVLLVVRGGWGRWELFGEGNTNTNGRKQARTQQTVTELLLRLNGDVIGWLPVDGVLLLLRVLVTVRRRRRRAADVVWRM